MRTKRARTHPYKKTSDLSPPHPEIVSFHDRTHCSASSSCSLAPEQAKTPQPVRSWGARLMCCRRRKHASGASLSASDSGCTWGSPEKASMSWVLSTGPGPSGLTVGDWSYQCARSLSPWEDSFLVSSAQLVRNEVEQWQRAVMLM